LVDGHEEAGGFGEEGAGVGGVEPEQEDAVAEGIDVDGGVEAEGDAGGDVEAVEGVEGGAFFAVAAGGAGGDGEVDAEAGALEGVGEGETVSREGAGGGVGRVEEDADALGGEGGDEEERE
jgi:hypothetical protein